jgi:phosphoribosylanthranilate isomerase
MWIKICGMTTREAVDAAIAAGANAIGFVFAPSKRQVLTAQALKLTVAVPSHVARVAVMQHPAQSLVDEVLSTFKPDILQTDYEDVATLRIPSTQQVLPVVRAGRDMPESLPVRLLFEGPVSGTGETADWQRAAALSKQTQLILAGGLHAANVGEAIAMVRPFGVDVSSGVESAPGVKDVKKIAEFVHNARASFLRSMR